LIMGVLSLTWKSPIMPGSSWKPLEPNIPVARILMLLSIGVGLPYFVLSATGPLLQAWFARCYPGASAYRLYSISNFGSLLALLSYPFVVEPHLRLGAQGLIWLMLYVVFAGGVFSCARSLWGVGENVWTRRVMCH